MDAHWFPSYQCTTFNNWHQPAYISRREDCDQNSNLTGSGHRMQLTLVGSRSGWEGAGCFAWRGYEGQSSDQLVNRKYGLSCMWWLQELQDRITFIQHNIKTQFETIMQPQSNTIVLSDMLARDWSDFHKAKSEPLPMKCIDPTGERTTKIQTHEECPKRVRWLILRDHHAKKKTSESQKFCLSTVRTNF